MIDILEELEQYGSIVIMEKEDECYAIFTYFPDKVKRVLKRHDIKIDGIEGMYAKEEKKKQSWMIDFCLK